MYLWIFMVMRDATTDIPWARNWQDQNKNRKGIRAIIASIQLIIILFICIIKYKIKVILIKNLKKSKKIYKIYLILAWLTLNTYG